MLKAGALFVAVTISFVIAVLISLLIVLAFHYKIQNRENLLQKKLERNVHSAITLLMERAEDENTLLDLYGEESDSVQIRKISWGIYQVASVKAFSGKYNLTKTVEYGYKPEGTQSAAVYLTDLSRPLNLCGKTKITGMCYLPEAGAKRGYIEGKSFDGANLINGKTINSKKSLPELNKLIMKKSFNFFSETPIASGVYKEVELSGIDSVFNSFLDTTILIRINGKDISGKYIYGNIILYSDKFISIEENSILEDVIVIAPGITIKKGFKGNLQAFAIDSIIVEENCKLNYPSALGVLKKDYKTQQPFIKLMKGTSLDGIAFTAQSEFVTDQKETLIILEKEATLTGQLFADGFADIKGEVRGTVWCNKFLLKTKASVYENHLLDAVIDRSKLSVHYVGSGLIASGKKKIIKWLE